jgi:hypothetical protein
MKKVVISITLISTFIICFGLMSMSRNSAKLNGSWFGVAVTTAGNCRLDYKFLTVGNHFVGTAVSPQGEATIVDGTINGSDIDFSISFKGHEVKHTGKYNDANNTITMDLDLGGAKLHTTLIQGK